MNFVTREHYCEDYGYTIRAPNKKKKHTYKSRNINVIDKWTFQSGNDETTLKAVGVPRRVVISPVYTLYRCILLALFDKGFNNLIFHPSKSRDHLHV